MKLALYQMKMEDDMEKNLKKSLDALKTAALNGADLIVYPELQLSPFFPQFRGYKDKSKTITLDGDILKSFRKACRDNSIMACPNFYLFENNSYFDASFLIDKYGDVLGCQKMVHIGQNPQFYEQDYYDGSDEGFLVFDTDYGKIGIVICFDRHYTESIRTEALKGADLILSPVANVKSEPLKMFEWEMRVQAYQNSVAIAMVNRVGREDDMEFAGQSMVCDADGNLLDKLGDSESILYIYLDLEEYRKLRNDKPYTRLRKEEFYL